MKFMLHSRVHRQDFFALLGPFFNWHMEIACDLNFGFAAEAEEDAVLQIAMLRLGHHVTDDSEVLAQIHSCVKDFNDFPGINASLQPYGHDVLIKGDLIEKLSWVDNSKGISHILTIAAHSTNCLKRLTHSDIYAR